METSSPPTDTALRYHYQLVYTLIDLLPPPLANTPDGFLARNNAAIAKVAALLPVNANETDLAAQCVAARAQAEDILRLIRQNADDIHLIMRLNAQYNSMVRTSLSALGRLMRVQAVRHKREAMEGAANQDAWTQHIAEQTMLKVVEADAKRQPASPEAAPTPTLAATQPEAAPASVNQPPAKTVSETDTNSQETPFETWMRSIPWDQVPTGSEGKPDPRHVLRDVLSKTCLADRKSPANGREPPATAN